MKNAAAIPRTHATQTMCQTCAVPVSKRIASAPWAAAPTRSAATMTTWRGTRSAQTPPTTRKRICGRKLAASTSPRSDGDPVRSTTAKARATGAMVLPSIEIVRPVKSRKKRRSPSGPSAAESLNRRTTFASSEEGGRVASPVRGAQWPQVLVDYHMHLRAPGSGSEELDHTVDGVERYVERARASGVDEIGITEHVYYFRETRDFWTLPYQ